MASCSSVTGDSTQLLELCLGKVLHVHNAEPSAPFAQHQVSASEPAVVASCFDVGVEKHFSKSK